jgi:hypothetical protein
MHRTLSNPLLIRLALWMVAGGLAVLTFLFWAGGWTQVLEYINDLFLLGPIGG